MDNSRSFEAVLAIKKVAVYDNGVEQTIKNLTPDPSPARLVLLVDNSLTCLFYTYDAAKDMREVTFEIYHGNQIIIDG